MKTLVTCLSSLVTAVALAAFAANATPRVPYANDFSTRTSGATPSGRWMESPYITGALVRSVGSISAHGREPYNNDTAYQDGWTMKTGYCRSSVLFTVADDGGNQGTLVNANSSSYQNNDTIAMQPFYNEFTNGVLKISVDIRTPPQTDSFNPESNAYALCAPVYKSTLDVTASTFSAPMYFGPASFYDNRGSKEGQEGMPLGWFLRTTLRGRTAADASASYFGQYDSRNSITAGSWVRYEAVIDLDAGRYTATYADLGTAHPTPDTAGGSPVAFHRWESDNSQFSFYFANPMTAKTGGIAGLAFYVRGIKQAANTADAPMFDNIAVSWKAPGADDFAPVYSNDFTTRRYRQVEPAGATTGAYALAPTTNTVQSSFYERASIVNAYGINEDSARRLVPDGAPYAGQDGWRRIAGTAPFTMVDPNKDSTGYGWDNATVLRATGSGKAGFVATPIGTTVTSGKVRLYFDMMMGVITNTSTSAGREIMAACFLAGNGAHSKTYTSSTSIGSAVQGYAVCGGGTRYYLAANASATGTRINHYSGGSSLANTQGPKSATDETLENKFIYAGRWGRYVITLDLGTRTYDYTVYQLSTTGRAMDYDHSSSSVIVSTNLTLASGAPASIDSVVLFSTGQADWNGGSEANVAASASAASRSSTMCVSAS